MSNEMGIYKKFVIGVTKNIDKLCEQCLSVQSAIKLFNLKLRKISEEKHMFVCV